MGIEQTDDGKHGSFKLLEDGVLAGEMAYTWAGDSMLIMTTRMSAINFVVKVLDTSFYMN